MSTVTPFETASVPPALDRGVESVIEMDSKVNIFRGPTVDRGVDESALRTAFASRFGRGTVVASGVVTALRRAAVATHGGEADGLAQPCDALDGAVEVDGGQGVLPGHDRAALWRRRHVRVRLVVHVHLRSAELKTQVQPPSPMPPLLLPLLPPLGPPLLLLLERPESPPVPSSTGGWSELDEHPLTAPPSASTPDPANPTSHVTLRMLPLRLHQPLDGGLDPAKFCRFMHDCTTPQSLLPLPESV